MGRTGTALITTGAIIVAFAAPMTHAQSSPQKAPPTTQSASAPSPRRDAHGGPLAGPKVVEGAHAPTLVEREADGRVRRLEIAPEERAIDVMKVEGAPARALAELFRKRARELDLFVAQNIDLLVKVNSETREAFKGALVLEGLGKLDVLWKDGTLEEQARALLPQARRDEFDALLREYWDAIIAERREREPGTKRFQIMLSEKGEGLGRELKSAFERTQRSGEFIYGYATRGLTGALALSREQEKRVRAACGRFADATGGGEGTKAQQATFALDLASSLHASQLEVVIATIQGRKIEPAKTDSALAPAIK